jgi:hypothetical protein
VSVAPRAVPRNLRVHAASVSDYGCGVSTAGYSNFVWVLKLQRRAFGEYKQSMVPQLPAFTLAVKTILRLLFPLLLVVCS